MAKPKDLKSRLKNADRRRRRRPSQAPVPDSQAAASGPSTDVTELLVSAILAERPCDATVIAALRATKTGIEPSHPQAMHLLGSLRQVADRDDVDGRGFRNAVDGLLKLSSQHDRNGDQASDSFVSYLALLTT